MQQRQPLTTGQVAKYCGVNFRTVIRWIERGQLRAFKLPGRGDNRIELPHFLEFLRKHDMPIPAELASIPDRALIVEDDLVMARTINLALTRQGFETRTAADCFRAGVLLGTFAPGVVTVDPQMAGVSGLEALRFLRSIDRFKDTKVMVVAAMPQAQLDAALEAGADAVLSKPFTGEQLAQKLLILVNGH